MFFIKESLRNSIVIKLLVVFILALITSCKQDPVDESDSDDYDMSNIDYSCKLPEIKILNQPVIESVFKEVVRNRTQEEKQNPVYVVSILDLEFTIVDVEWSDPIKTIYLYLGQGLFYGYVRVEDCYFLIKGISQGEFAIQKPFDVHIFKEDSGCNSASVRTVKSWRYFTHNGKYVLGSEPKIKRRAYYPFAELDLEYEINDACEFKWDDVFAGQTVLQTAYSQMERGDVQSADSLINEFYTDNFINADLSNRTIEELRKGSTITYWRKMENENDKEWNIFLKSMNTLIPGYRRFDKEIESLPSYRKMQDFYDAWETKRKRSTLKKRKK